jgi:hypothetical protein
VRWSNADLAVGELVIVRNLIVRAGQLVEKDTKTYAARRIALSDDSIALLAEHQHRCTDRAQAIGTPLAPDAYVFSFDPAGRTPMNPDAVTHRFGRLAKQLGLHARLHDLRHYAATQLIAGGVDVRTVSDRPRRRRRDHPEGLHAPPGGSRPARGPAPRADAQATELNQPGRWVMSRWSAVPGCPYGAVQASLLGPSPLPTGGCPAPSLPVADSPVSKP